MAACWLNALGRSTFLDAIDAHKPQVDLKSEIRATIDRDMIPRQRPVKIWVSYGQIYGPRKCYVSSHEITTMRLISFIPHGPIEVENQRSCGLH